MTSSCSSSVAKLTQEKVNDISDSLKSDFLHVIEKLETDIGGFSIKADVHLQIAGYTIDFDIQYPTQN